MKSSPIRKKKRTVGAQNNLLRWSILRRSRRSIWLSDKFFFFRFKVGRFFNVKEEKKSISYFVLLLLKRIFRIIGSGCG